MTDDFVNREIEIHFNSDGTHSVVVKLNSPEEALEVTMQAREIEKLIGLSSCIEKLRTASSQEGDILVFPKPASVSDEIRLVACAAAAYPDGFPQDAIESKLNIADTSRDSYINWDTKESSKYLAYNPSTKKVYVSPDGIDWICSQLKTRGVQGF